MADRRVAGVRVTRPLRAVVRAPTTTGRVFRAACGSTRARRVPEDDLEGPDPQHGPHDEAPENRSAPGVEQDSVGDRVVPTDLTQGGELDHPDRDDEHGP